MNKLLLFFLNIILFNSLNSVHSVITNHQDPNSSSQLGDSIINYYNTKILYHKYKHNLTFYLSPFKYGDLFYLHDYEPRIPKEYEEMSNKKNKLLIKTEKNFFDVLEKFQLISGDLALVFDTVTEEESNQAKKWIRLKKIPQVDILPHNIVTVAVHIRKGNGGGEIYDGEMASPQLYKLNRKKIVYKRLAENYQFEFEGHCVLHGKRPEKDSVDRGLPFVVPPEQYYIDQILTLSDLTDNIPLHVQIFTDDKNPEELVKRIKKLIKKSNITIAFYNNKHKTYRDRIAEDLYLMSQCDILIRSQSNFAKIAELLGNHKLVFYPVEGKWSKNRLIMTKVIIKGEGF